MGLDIYTHRLTKTKSDNFFALNDKEVTQFKKDGLGDFICTKEETFLDFPAYFGVTKNEYYDKYECAGVSCSNEEEKYAFIDKKNPLYAIHQKICSILFFSGPVYNGIGLTEEDTKVLKDNNLVLKDFTNDSLHSIIDSLCELLKIEVVITPNFPRITLTVTGVYYEDEELAYQRNGLTQKYYEDYKVGKFNFFVTNKAVMQDIYDNYVLEEYKDNFKKLLDSFVQGETIAIFSW